MGVVKGLERPMSLVISLLNRFTFQEVVQCLNRLPDEAS